MSKNKKSLPNVFSSYYNHDDFSFQVIYTKVTLDVRLSSTEDQGRRLTSYPREEEDIGDTDSSYAIDLTNTGHVEGYTFTYQKIVSTRPL